MSAAPLGAAQPKAITITYTAPTVVTAKGTFAFAPSTLNVPAGQTDDITWSLSPSNNTVNFTSFTFSREDGMTDTNTTTWMAAGASANGKNFSIRDAAPAGAPSDVQYNYCVSVAGRIGSHSFADSSDPMIINKGGTT